MDMLISRCSAYFEVDVAEEVSTPWFPAVMQQIISYVEISAYLVDFKHSPKVAKV